MQERQVTVGGTRHQLPEPFFVLATQNPIEQEGTYPLPEAQLDRFMFNILVDYPDEEEEFEIVEATTTDVHMPQVDRVAVGRRHPGDAGYRAARCRCADHVIRYAMQFTRLTRREKGRRAATSSATT